MSKQQKPNDSAMWVIVFVIIFALLYSTRAMWGAAVDLDHDDLSIGIGNTIPDAEEIGKRFR